MKHNVHAIFINESSINPTIPVYLPIESFDPITYQHKRESNGFKGGVIIYIKRSISHQIKPYYIKYGIELSQACGIKMDNMNIIAMYRSPSQERESFTIWNEEFRKIINNPKNILIGDLNLHINWQDRIPEQSYYSTTVDNFLETQSNQFVTKPTCHKSDPPRILDVVITKAQNLIHSTLVLDELDVHTTGIDHNPVLIRINKQCKSLDSAEIYSRKYKNVKKYRQMMEHVDWNSIAMENDLNKLTLNYVHIVNAIDKETYLPITIKNNTSTQLKFSDKTNELSRALIRAKKRLDLLKISEIRKQLRISRTNDRKTWNRNMVKKFSKNRNAIWSELQKARIKSSTNGGLRLNPDDELTFCPQEKCEILRQQYKRVMSPKLPISQDLHQDPNPCLLRDADFNQEQILMQLKRIHNSYARGLDGSYMKMIRDAKYQLLGILEHIFTRIFKESHIPEIWLNIKIAPLEKKNDLELAKNWRPISVSSSHLKVMEAIIGNVLNNHLNEHGMLNDKQYGFRRQRSVDDNMTVFVHKLSSMMDKYSHASVFYADSSSAFDTVNHSILLQKCKDEFKIGGLFLKFLRAWLTGNGNGRQQTVHWNNTTSKLEEITSSVIQGSSLGPTLWLMYVNDVINKIEQWKHELHIPEVEVLFFADDAKIIFHGSKEKIPKIETLVSKIVEELSKIFVKFNPDKCSVWCLGKKNPRFIIKMKNPDGTITKLKNVDQERDLGVLVSSSQNYIWEAHMNKVLATSKSASKAVYKSLLAMDWTTRIQTYFSEVFSRMSFASVVWTKSYQDQKYMDRFNEIYIECFKNAVVPEGKVPPLLPQQIFFQRDILYLYKAYHNMGPVPKEVIFPETQLRISGRSRRNGVGEIYVYPRSKFQNPLRMGLILNRNLLIWNAIPQSIKDITDKKLFMIYVNQLLIPEMACEKIREKILDGSLRRESAEINKRRKFHLERLKTCKELDIPSTTVPEDVLFTEEFDCDFLELEKEENLVTKKIGGVSNELEKRKNGFGTENQKTNMKILQMRKRKLRKKINKIRKHLDGVNLCKCNNKICNGDYSCIIPDKKIINGEVNDAKILEDRKMKRAFEDWILDENNEELTPEEKIMKMKMVKEKISSMDYQGVNQDVFES